MFFLTDEVIEAAIDSISRYIVSTVALMSDKSIEEVAEKYLASDTYALLSDKETGYYWDNINELIELFCREIQCIPYKSNVE